MTASNCINTKSQAYNVRVNAMECCILCYPVIRLNELLFCSAGQFLCCFEEAFLISVAKVESAMEPRNIKTANFSYVIIEDYIKTSAKCEENWGQRTKLSKFFRSDSLFGWYFGYMQI